MLTKSVIRNRIGLIILFLILSCNIANADIFGSSGGGSISDEAYGISWDNVTDEGASKNAIYDVISGLGGGHDALTLAASADTLLGLSTQELSLDTQTANYVFAGPASGAAAVPTFRALVTADMPSSVLGQPIATFTIDGWGNAISTTAPWNQKAIPYACTITAWHIDSDISGNIKLDVETAADTPYTTFASIAGTELPAISSAQTANDTSLTTWTTAITANTRIRVTVNGTVTPTVKKAVLTIYGTRT